MLFISLLLVQLLIFGVLVLFLRLIIAKNVSHATSHLNEIGSDYGQKLEEAKKRQAEAEKYYDETLLKAKTDAEKIKAQILKEARELEENLVSTARKQGEDIIQQANKAKEGILSDAEKHIAHGAMLRACELVEEILPSEITREMHEKWCADLLKHGFDALKRLNLPDTLQDAQISSAYPLETSQKTAIEKKIKEELGRALKITEKHDPALIAGLCVKLGSVVVDGSLKFKISEALRHAKSTVQR